MITLHESNITSFPHDNGIGVLKDVIRAYAEEELNGMFEFYMEYDSEGHLVDELKEERIIKAKAQDKLGYQLFRIYSITKNHENDNLIVRAQHITYDLADNFVEKLEANNLTKKQVMELIGSSTVLPHPFFLTSSNTTTRSSTKLYRTNPLQMVGGIEGSVLQIWGGQIERDNFNLILHDRRGSDDGVKVTYEKNITGLEATFDISGLVTRIFPFVYIEATDNEPARLITVDGKYIDSPHINDYEKIYIKPIDYSNDERIDIQDKTDAQIRQQLTNIASKYFEETGNDKIKVDMEVQFEHLWETEEYKDLAVLELVGMGDTVTIEHSRLKVDATAIVNYIRYDCIAEKNEEVRLGSVKARLTDNVNKVVDVAEKAERAEKTANQAIRAANGKNTIYYGPDEPEGGIEGDLWFRVVDGEYTRTYRHDGIQWQLVLSVDVRDAIDEAQQAKDEAQSAVNRANQATQQATNAINQAQIAFDEAQQALSTASNAYDIATTLQGDVTNLSTLVDEHTGQISSITQSVTGLQTHVSDIEGNVSTLTQTAQGLQSTVSSLQDELHGLEIGGRNLIRNSDFSKGLEHWQSNGSILLVNVDGKKAIKLTGTTNGFYQYPTNLEENTYYTISLKAKSVGETSSLRFGFLNQGAGLERTINVDSTWRKYTFTTTQFINFNRNTLLHFYANNETAEGVYITEIKLEKGNKATDWTPAPEDIDHQFSVITQTIDNITTRIGDAEGNITALQQTSVSLAGRLSDAEGNITTLTATVNGLQTTVSNIEGDVSSVTQLANALQTRMTNAEGDISTLTQTASSLQSTVSSLQDEWDNLEIGGRNLLRDTALTHEGLGAWAGLPEVKWDDEYPYVEMNYGWGLSQIIPKLNAGTYTISVLAKEGTNPKSRVRFSTTNKNLVAATPLTNKWQRVSATFTVTEDIENWRVYFLNADASEGNARIKFTHFKLEKGNRATDWTPAPEDMATQSQITQLSDAINLRVMKGDVINQINISDESILIDGKRIHITGQTTIDNGVIKSAHIQSLDAGKITTGVLDAGKVSVINLNASNITSGSINADLITIANNKIRLDNNGLYVYKNGIEGASLVEGNLTFNDQSNGQRIGRFAATVWSDNVTKGISMNMEPNRYISFGHYVGGSTGYEPMVVINPGTAMAGVPRGLVSNLPYRANDDIWMGKQSIRFGLNTNHNHSAIWQGVGESLYIASYTGVRLGYLTSGGVMNDRLTVDNNSVDIWQDLDMHGWKILRVGDLQYNSNIEYKTDIHIWEESALEKIKSSVIYEYKLKQDVDKGILLNKHGLVIGDGYETPAEFVEQNFIDVYQMTSWSWKAIQELDSKAENIADDVEWLKLENQYLRQKVKQLEEMIA